MSDGATAAAAGAGGSAEGPVPPPSKGKGEDSGGWEEELAALRSQVARLSRRVVEQGDELELERGRLVMAASELAEARRQSAELQSQLTAARASGAGSGAGQARTPRPPSWSPAGSARRSKTGARPRSPLTDLQQQRLALKPVHRPVVVPDDSSQKSLLEKNKVLTVALLRAEAEYKRDRDRSNRMIAKLQHTVERLAREAEGFTTAAQQDVVRSHDIVEAQAETAKYRKLYQEEVRRRMITERKSTKALALTQRQVSEKGQRLQKIEREMVALQRQQPHLKPKVSRAWLGLPKH